MRAWPIYIAVAVGGYAVSSMMQADRDSTGAIVGAGNIDAFQMRVGDCFNDNSALSSGGAAELSEVPGVPCAEPHDNEVFAVFDLDLQSFPEDDDIADIALDSCLQRFEPFVGKDYESSSLDVVTMYPTQDSWNTHHDREVVCAVYDMNATRLVGTVEGLAL
jgi:Septum formation